MREKINNRTVKSFKPGDRPFEVSDVDLPGFTLRVQPSGVRTFYARYRLPQGGQNRVRIGRAGVLTVAQAREKARQILADAVQGLDPGEAKRAGKGHTLGSFLDEVYEEWCVSNRKEGRGITDRIRSSFGSLLGKKLDELNAWTVERWRTKRLKGKCKISTSNRDLAYLKAALSRAVEWGALSEHPLKSVKLKREDHTPKVRYLSDDEESALMSALDSREERIRAERDSANRWREERGYRPFPDLRQHVYSDHLKPMVLLSLHLGVRRGELFDLQWADIDFDRRVLSVRGGTAKSGKTRHLPMNDVAYGVLEDWQKQTGKTGLVFKNSAGKRFDHVNSAWRRIMKEAGITNFRWHDLRHSFASKLVQAGVDLNVVRELLGHSDLRVTLKYAHLAPRQTTDAVAKLVRPDNEPIAFPAANGQEK